MKTHAQAQRDAVTAELVGYQCCLVRAYVCRANQFVNLSICFRRSDREGISAGLNMIADRLESKAYELAPAALVDEWLALASVLDGPRGSATYDDTCQAIYDAWVIANGGGNRTDAMHEHLEGFTQATLGMIDRELTDAKQLGRE